jgi:HAD superfamily hydrolase (TIGR01493 family)
MPNRPLDGVKACVFDAYGTLFDFASAARACPDVPGEAAGRLTALWRDKQVQYTWLRAAQGRHADFAQVTADALDFALETLGLERPGLRGRLLDLYLTLAAFPEVPQVLARVRAAGLKTAILSNCSPRSSARPGSPARSMPCCRWKRSAPSSRTRGSTGSRSTGWASPRPRSPSCRRTAGTLMRHRRSACRWCGATATAKDANGCQVAPTAK